MGVLQVTQILQVTVTISNNGVLQFTHIQQVTISTN